MNKPQLVGAAPKRRTRTLPKSAAWLTPKDAAEHLGVGVSIVYAACASGSLRHFKPGHSTIRIRPAWLDEWAESSAK